MREQTKQSPLHKESHANFENILENRWTRWRVFENLHIQQRQNQCSVQELNQTTSPAPQTPRIQVTQQEANLITFTLQLGSSKYLQMQGTAVGSQEQPK